MNLQTLTVPTDMDADILQTFHQATRALRTAYADIERLASNGQQALAQGKVAFTIGGNTLAKVAETQARFEATSEMLRLATGVTREQVQAAMTADALVIRTADEEA
jgi:virulence-associated protein VapD